MAALVLTLLGALGGAGWWLLKSFGNNEESSSSSPTQDSTAENTTAELPPPSTEEEGSRPSTFTEADPSRAETPTEDPTLGEGAETRTTPPLRGAQESPPPALPQPEITPPVRTTPPPPPSPRVPPRSEPPPPAAPQTPASSASPPTSSGQATVPQKTPEPTVAEHLTAFDQAAGRAQREITSGRLLTFQVEPEEALIRVWRRGDERQRVMGQAQAYAPKNRNSNSLELPEAGQYLITLVAEGFPDFVIYALIEDGRGPAPRRIQVSLRVASTRSGVERIRVARSLAFRGSPKDAEVYVNDARKGPAGRWPGGGRASSAKHLQLAPGLHKIRLEAPGYRPFEVEVEVTPDARRRVQTIEYALRR